MRQYNFDFSVIMAVYNAEPYLREAIDSLIHQTIGFSHIQLILVDDGSTDKSGVICDDYQKRYSENIFVIHKENGRQASARNAGLKLVRGKYVNFMDSDDTMERSAFKKVYDFMESHEGEVDVCCIPMYFFGDMRGPHMLNNKFDQGTKVIDLMQPENSDCILMNVSTSFYTRSASRKIQFDPDLYIAEDAKAALSVLMDNPRLGVVTGTHYNYRKFGGSTIDKSSHVAITYIQHLKCFSNWILDRAMAKYGSIPDFIQFAIMYELQWKVAQKSIPTGLLTVNEAKDYKKLLIQTICRIDDNIILQQKYLESAYKTYILSQKYTCPPKLNILEADITLTYEDTVVATVSNMRTVWDFLVFDSQKNTCTIEGYHILFSISQDTVQPYLYVNGQEISCDIIDRNAMAQKCLGEEISYAIGFRATFPLQGDDFIIKPAVCVDGRMIIRDQYSFRDYFPISDVYENAYACMQGRMVTLERNSLKIANKPILPIRIAKECRLLREIWDKNLLGGRKAVGGRIYYHLIKLFKRKKLWIISDRVNKADDNGEALFRYLQKHKPKNTRVIFAIRKDSGDYERMEKVGKCVSAMSFHHKLLYLLADVNISSHAEVGSMFSGYRDALRDLLQRQHFVFLQHGIIHNDVSGWLNRYNKNMSGFVTAARPEWQSIVEGDYHYANDIIWLTGLPRHDRLYQKEEKKVTLMPTWRQYLMVSCDSRTGVWSLARNFTHSEYFRFYDALLNSDRLLKTLEDYGYTLCFFPHPTIQPHVGKFHHDPRVTFLPLETAYRDVYAKSNLVISDYSSAIFDFAYLRKPVIYCQFDKDHIFQGNHICTKGYFDFERDGFGEVTYDLDSCIDLIIDYVKNDCKLKEKYHNRIDAFFAFKDRNNCQRVLEKLISLPEKG